MRPDRRSFLTATGTTIAALSLTPGFLRRARAQANVVKVASIHDLSGGLDIYGRPMVDCLNFAVDEINGAGGLLGRQVKLISYDPQSNIQLYTQFATEAATRERVAVVHAGITSASREAATGSKPATAARTPRPAPPRPAPHPVQRPAPNRRGS